MIAQKSIERLVNIELRIFRRGATKRKARKHRSSRESFRMRPKRAKQVAPADGHERHLLDEVHDEIVDAEQDQRHVKDVPAGLLVDEEEPAMDVQLQDHFR